MAQILQQSVKIKICVVEGLFYKGMPSLGLETMNSCHFIGQPNPRLIPISACHACQSGV